MLQFTAICMYDVVDFSAGRWEDYRQRLMYNDRLYLEKDIMNAIRARHLRSRAGFQQRNPNPRMPPILQREGVALYTTRSAMTLWGNGLAPFSIRSDFSIDSSPHDDPLITGAGVCPKSSVFALRCGVQLYAIFSPLTARHYRSGGICQSLYRYRKVHFCFYFYVRVNGSCCCFWLHILQVPSGCLGTEYPWKRSEVSNGHPLHVPHEVVSRRRGGRHE